MNTKSTFRMSSLRKAALGLAALGLTVGAAQAQTVYGLSVTGTTTASLVTFNATTPGTFTATVPITGVTAGQTIVGIDVRPNTGQLFALGYNPTGTQAQMYTIDRTTGVATTVGTALTLNLGTNVARIGFDFNPTVDRIRVVSGAGTDFRLNPNNGALAATDGNLAYATGDANASQTPSVGSVAYTNSYIGSTGTDLYDIDEANSRLVIQRPPNNGTLVTVGPLGIATDGAGQISDLDIYFNPTTSTNVAYLSTATITSLTAATSTLYTVNLATGATTSVGLLGTGPLVVISDIAFAIDRPTLPAITGQLAYALAGTNLISFDTALPTTIRGSVGITGIDAAQTLVGLDVRPLNNALYALGYNATTQTGQLYAINATTGAATSISGSLALALGTGSIGFDFNPTVDRIRVVGANGNNYRLNPVTGTLAATDGVLSYAGGGTPNIGAVAYTNSFTGASTTSGTTLYNYDETLNQLNTQSTANPPMDGQLTAVGTSGITVNTTTPNVDIDIYSTGAGVNTGYLVATTGTSPNSGFYTLNLTTGAATLVGNIGNGITVRDIAIAGAAGVATSTRAAELATGFILSPNPVAGEATAAFTLPRAGQAELTVIDALGRTVERLSPGKLNAGTHSVRWQPGSRTTGLYFVRLSLDGQPAGTQRVFVQ
ncbi:DUF4394 domain-containing protein [Hymenobacter mucosus]|uniref:DUF4394 domain-containing protein n=1 Tax=Hymenobacter mucosus TaxID=1411120 RepID=A0A238W0P7_9BACT|nr:DUF4394 domain-containing protein [Hymenobacter mucosus]SNR40068.1 protein of unknown function [Hymenobacter mucosus]